MKNPVLRSLMCSFAALAASQAFALGANTTTQLRCFYKTNNSSTDASSNYVWAISPTSTLGLPYKISGNWWKDGITSIQNMYFTATSQATLKSVCASTFTKKGITQPLMMMAAADTPLSLNYTIWTNDPATQPAKISKVIVFGDSVSDTQNLYNATQWQVPNKNSWFLGHFTNGKVWNEYVTDALNLPNYNWAVAGAAADDYYVIPGVVSQVDSYLSYMQSAPNYKPANSLIAMLIGGNDLANYNRTVASILANEQQALENLIASGARNILLLNVPDLSRAPKYSAAMGLHTDQERLDLQAHVNELNQGLVTMRNALQAKYGSALNIKIFDTKAKVDDMINNKAAYGITNIDQSCLDLADSNSSNYLQSHAMRAGCTNADAYVFWDLLHPTTHSHKVIADAVVPFVKANYPM